MDLSCVEELPKSRDENSSVCSFEESLKNALPTTEETRNWEYTRSAFVDKAIAHHPRVLEFMLKAEDRFVVDMDHYFATTTMRPRFRKMLTEWMVEVCCSEKYCCDNVFLRAVAYMDLYISKHANLNPSCFQAIASVCILISSKMSGPYIPIRQLIFYTDNCMDEKTAIALELEILEDLKWDMEVLTVCDFVNHILPILSDHWSSTTAIHRQEITTIMHYCATDHFFARKPSVVAAASIMAILKRKINIGNLDLLLEEIAHLIGASPVAVDTLANCINDKLNYVMRDELEASGSKRRHSVSDEGDHKRQFFSKDKDLSPSLRNG